MKIVALLVLALVSAGCGRVRITTPPAVQYDASICAAAAGQEICATLDAVTIRGDGQAFAELVIGLGGPYLLKQFNYQGCLFTTYAEDTKSQPGKVVVTGTASCQLNTVRVPAKVVVTLAPTAPPPA